MARDALEVLNPTRRHVAMNARLPGEVGFGALRDGLLPRHTIASRALVVRLLFRRSPSTIARLVIAVVVYAIDGPAGRPLSHVREKIAEVHPTLADRNSTAAVVGVAVSA